MITRIGVLVSCSFILLLLSACLAWPQPVHGRQPIIDMHLHAHTLSMYGTPPPTICTNDQEIFYPPVDPREPGPMVYERVKSCPARLSAPSTDEELLRTMLDMLQRYNVRAVATGPLEQVTKWRAAAPDRIIPAVPFDDYRDAAGGVLGAPGYGRGPEVFRRLFREGRFTVFAEISAQYNGLSPADESLEPYFALAEELDVPVGIHMGEGPPGAAYLSSPKYRARLTSPFLLEEVLVRHPRLRVYVMHYGSPLVDEMMSMLHSHPQLYVDVACNDWSLPRKEFHGHLRRLMEGGFGKRILFGSDAMVWPRTIEVAIQSIESAEFLTAEQKRDIFYNNAVRFLRLKHEEVTKHPGNQN
jgi:predicted TIM-barrel fold metal-dependent hydrolase